MKRSCLAVVSVALAVTIVLVAGCGPAAVRETTTAVLAASASSSTTSTSESLLEQYRAQLVSPADLADPTLARIVSGLLGRGIPVISATVTSSFPLKISLTVPGTKEGRGPVLALSQAEREAAAEWVREGKLSEIELKIEDPSGQIVPVAAIPLPAGVNITPEAVPPATVDLVAAKRLLEESIGPLISAPLELLTLDLTEDVLDARLLHIRLLVPDFPRQIEAYEAANAAIGAVADRLTQEAGIAVGVVWIDAVNEQGQLWTASWGDVQLNSAAGQNGLAQDYFPSSWPRPATPSTVGQGVSSGSTD